MPRCLGQQALFGAGAVPDMPWSEPGLLRSLMEVGSPQTLSLRA